MTDILRNIILFTVILAAGSVLSGECAEFSVTYLSAEHVYIDGGSEDGLRVGDRLGFAQNGADTIIVEVVFTAGHSASCKLAAGSVLPQVGTRLFLYEGGNGLNDDDNSAIAAPAINADKSESSPVQPPVKSFRAEIPVQLSGSFSLGYNYWDDRGPGNYDYNRTNGRLNLKARRLWNENVTLAVRTRGRYLDRRRAYSLVDRSAWENRLWELSLTYESPDGRLLLTGGRLLPRQIGSVGYLDGVLAEINIYKSMALGVFGGLSPDWLYDSDRLSLTKGGGFLSISHTSDNSVSFEQTIGAVAEVHTDNLSRSYLITRGTVRYGRFIGFSHSSEIDVYTGWRKERAGKSITVSRAFLRLFLRINEHLRLSANYDNYQRYWTYEYFTLADSLFDDRVRQGWRLRTTWTPNHNWCVSASGGWRDRPGSEKATVSYSFSIRRTGVIVKNMSITTTWSGFDGAFENGTDRSIRLQLYNLASGQWHFDFRDYGYSVDGIDGSRRSYSFATGMDYDFARNYYTGALIQYSDGDDITGWQLRANLGYRF